ncbi:MAG: hypothetical protein PHQ27_05140 [Victivallales bacterium]|nr:hypothetical protein [Victivallales bacterium]
MSPKPELIARLEELKPRLTLRAGLIAALRRFYADHGFLETETPVLIPAPAPEEYIEAPAAVGGFLRSSPELEMKCLLAAGYDRIFQLGPCFRRDEYGRRHRPEFTMLEWYQSGADYLVLAEFTRAMLIFAARQVLGRTTLSWRGRTIELDTPWQYLSVRDAYRDYAGVAVETALAADSFDELMVTKIEPQLGWGRPTLLLDYPACRSSLARLKASDPTVAERWELYLGGLEIANAFSELTAAGEQRERFRQARENRRRDGGQDYPEASDFLTMLDYGLPESSGCALGVDRLAMVWAAVDDIGEITYPR